MMVVLNVGGGRTRTLPKQFEGWDQHVLDIDPETEPEILLDARRMHELAPESYDGIWCSHNLEHYLRHEVPGVLGGFRHVLKKDGMALLSVPDIGALMKACTDLEDTWYECESGQAISFHDVLYGWGEALAAGKPYYAHRCGFTKRSLENVLRSVFPVVRVESDGANLNAMVRKCP